MADIYTGIALEEKKKSPDCFLITKVGHLISVIGDFFVCCPVNSGYSVEMGQSLLTSSGLLKLRMTKEI